jgi:hypothetical protein
MYGYMLTFVIVFLTHPGVAYNFFDPGVPGGIFHALVVLLLQSPSDGKMSLSYTMAIIYWILLAVWAYVKVRLLLSPV